MAIATKQAASVLPRTEGLVEMNWDPITRIVGSLGIFTKIDFKNKEVKECYNTSAIFRGYSVIINLPWQDRQLSSLSADALERQPA